MYCLLLLSYIFRHKISALSCFTLAPTEDCYMLPIVKVHPRTGHKGPEGEQMYSYTFPSTSALDGGGWSKPRAGRFISWKDSVPIVYVTYTTHFPLGSPDSRVIGTKFPPPPSHTNFGWSREYCTSTLHNNNTIKVFPCRAPSICIHLSFFVGVRFQDRREERKSANNWKPLPPKKFLFFWGGFFSLYKHYEWDVLLSSRHVLAVWPKGLFVLSNNSDAQIHWTVRVVYFYSWGDPVKLRNYEIRTREKWEMTLLPRADG